MYQSRGLISRDILNFENSNHLGFLIKLNEPISSTGLLLLSTERVSSSMWFWTCISSRSQVEYSQYWSCKEITRCPQTWVIWFRPWASCFVCQNCVSMRCLWVMLKGSLSRPPSKVGNSSSSMFISQKYRVNWDGTQDRKACWMWTGYFTYWLTEKPEI